MDIGDYVEVDIGMSLCAIGKIVTIHEMHRDNYSTSTRHRVPTGAFLKRSRETFHIRFLDGTTHTASVNECKKLDDKQVFVLKLKDQNEMAKIYEALDER